MRDVFLAYTASLLNFSVMENIINVEAVTKLVSIQVENSGTMPHDFELFGSLHNRNAPNFGNHPDIKISLPSGVGSYEQMLVDSLSVESIPLISFKVVGFKVVNVYCDSKRKFLLYGLDKLYNKKQIGKVTASLFPKVMGRKAFSITGENSMKPDGWMLQPKEKVVIDFEIEYQAAVQEHIVKPTAFIKLLIENKSGEPQRYELFNANLRAGMEFYDKYSNPNVEITWDTTKMHYSSIGKSYTEQRKQTYKDLLSAIKWDNLVLNVVNVFSPEPCHWSFSDCEVGGGRSSCIAKKAFPYPLAHYDKSIFQIRGNTTLTSNLSLPAYGKTFIELEVEQD